MRPPQIRADWARTLQLPRSKLRAVRLAWHMIQVSVRLD